MTCEVRVAPQPAFNRNLIPSTLLCWKTMCVETPRPGMDSDSRAKHNAKPLSADAEPFSLTNNSFLRLPHEIYSGQIEVPYPQLALPTDMVPPFPPSLSPPHQTEPGLVCVYSEGPVMLIPNSIEAMNGFGPYQAAYWYPSNPGFYNHVPASYDVEDINTRVSNRRMGRTRITTSSVAPSTSPQWRVKARNKNTVHQTSKSGGGTSTRAIDRPLIPFPSTLEEAESSETTTVMIKNIPYHYRFKDLLQIVDYYCRKENRQCADPSRWAKYDFIYLPMDYIIHARDSKLSNLGYAFVNFTTTVAAFKFYEQFHGYKWDEGRRRKPCEITCAKLQGKEMLKNRFERKIFKSKCPSFRPVEYSPARDGFNVGIRGKPVGKYVEGLPRRDSS
ncbi:hypothetical protein L6164_030521 [Bauhinia variegata]|uniref:Uncharacterized protein n=1 Tax=Bauhinia variegata TaxID=167791 RepID=A0ACB9LDX9_BAUVA|nr:hypothetical protein L6164_030521 [Bauhinia variegata]